jgi:hypothetical protein
LIVINAFSLLKLTAPRAATATVFTASINLATLIIASWQDAPPPAPKHSGDVDLSQAFEDVKFVRKGATTIVLVHTYNSHQNDVHNYILVNTPSVTQSG